MSDSTVGLTTTSSRRATRSEAADGLRVLYSPTSGPIQGDRALSVIRFGEGGLQFSEGDAPLVVDVDLPQLCGEPLVEIWESSKPVARGEVGEVRFATDGDSLFGAVSLEVSRGASLESATHHAYSSVFSLLDELGCEGLLRMWNCIPRINAMEEGLERYRRFCRARFNAFRERFGDDFTRKLCASSAVGGLGSELVVYFVASRGHGVHWENPRQVSAYHYPERYGPRSPSFARATTAPTALGSSLFVSGTASIVGYETRHDGDTLAQLAETLRNIGVVVDCATASAPISAEPLEQLSLVKVYLRREEDVGAVSIALDDIFGNEDPANRLMLRADICRGDLTVEIEAVVNG